VKVVRAIDRHLWVPVNPEVASKNQKVKLVEAGSVALVPDDFNEGNFEVVRMAEKKKKPKGK